MSDPTTEELIERVRETLLHSQHAAEVADGSPSFFDPALAALDSLAAALKDCEWNRKIQKTFGEEQFARAEALAAALEREKREAWREGLVNVLDHDGNYLGCMGSETWEWTLDGGIAELKSALERAEQRIQTQEDDLHYYNLAVDRAEAAEARAQKAEAALRKESELRIKDCEERNAYKRRADMAEAALRLLAETGGWRTDWRVDEADPERGRQPTTYNATQDIARAALSEEPR